MLQRNYTVQDSGQQWPSGLLIDKAGEQSHLCTYHPPNSDKTVKLMTNTLECPYTTNDGAFNSHTA